MKTLLYISFLTILLQTGAKAQASNPDCPNGDAENNSFSNWQTLMAASTAPTQVLNLFTAGFSPTRTGVHDGSSAFPPSGPLMFSGGVDQYGGFAVPSQGTYFFRVGNNSSNAEADMMHYSFMVTANNAQFKFRYAVVLQDGGHTNGENPWVSMYMNLGTSHMPDVNSPIDLNLWSTTMKTYIANANDPYFKLATTTSRDPIVYKEWQCVEYDLRPYIGSVVSFNFIARDCSQGGHFGYAYLDGLCTSWPAIASMTINKTEFCDDGNPVIVDASASTGENRYFLEVAESDAAGYAISGGDVASQWFIAQQAPANINVNQFFTSAGKRFKCGSYYRVNVAVMNDCSEWNVQTRVIHFNCPPINAGKDIALCCGKDPNTGTLNLGELPGQPGYSYQWQSYPAGFTDTKAQTSVTIPSKSTAYILTVKDDKGCMVTDSVIVRYQNPEVQLQVTKDYYDGYEICDLNKYYSASVTNADCPNEDPYFMTNYPVNTIKWQVRDKASNTIISTGTGPSFVAPNANANVETSIVNACAAITKVDYMVYKGTGNSLIAPNSFAPNGANPLFQILDYGLNAPPLGQGPAYNAVNFNLYIFDRGGTIIKRLDKFSIGRQVFEPLMNGDIQWDGTDHTGNVVPLDVYTYVLNMQYCGSDKMEPACIEGASMQSMCFNWIIDFWGLNYVCNDRRNVCVGHVTVVQ